MAALQTQRFCPSYTVGVPTFCSPACVRGVLSVISSRRGRISGITPTHPNFRYLKRTEPLYLFFFFFWISCLSWPLRLIAVYDKRG